MRLVQEMRQESRQIDKSSGLRLFSFSFHFDYEFLKGTSKNSKTHTHTPLVAEVVLRSFKLLQERSVVIQHSLFVAILHLELINHLGRLETTWL